MFPNSNTLTKKVIAYVVPGLPEDRRLEARRIIKPLANTVTNLNDARRYDEAWKALDDLIEQADMLRVITGRPPRPDLDDCPNECTAALGQHFILNGAGVENRDNATLCDWEGHRARL